MFNFDQEKKLLNNIKILEEENQRLRELNFTEDTSLYKEFLDALPEIVFEMTLDGRIIFVNQAGLNYLGYTDDEFKEAFEIDVFFPKEYQIVKANLTKLINEEPFEKRSYLAQKKNGELFPVILSTTLVKKKNHPIAVRGIIIDISKQQESEERFKNLFNSSPFPTVIFSPETGDIFMSNPKANVLFGIKKEALSDRNIFFFIHDTGELSFRNYIQLIQTHEKKEIDYNTVLSKAEGEKRDIKISSIEITISGKKYIQSIFQDITLSRQKELKEIKNRKQKELLALSVFQLNHYKEKDSMFRYIAQTLQAFSPKSIIIIGDYLPEKNKLKLNHILGSRIEKISEILKIDINKFEMDVVHYPLPENRLFVDIEKVLDDNNLKTNLSRIKFNILKKVLQIKKIYTTKIIVNNNVLGGIAILTPNVNFLEENEFIEIFVSQAGIILDRIDYEKQLIQSKKEAIESDRLKSIFLSNMSHEIRTPMNSILGFSNLILNDDLTPELKSKYSDLMQSSGEILVKLIDDIIDISKIESNQLEVLQEDFLVNDIIEELEVEYLNLFDTNQKQIKMSFINSQEPVYIKSDRSRIKQILNNLINNSTKFTIEGTIDIWFEIKEQQIVFHVKDSGIGIPKDKQEIIFDRFRQADESPIRPFRGAGLGLAISKHLSNLLGGDILVDSQKNRGTEFMVVLPTNKKQYISNQKQYIKPIQKNNYEWKNYTVFIAEDEESNFFLLEAYLKETQIKINWYKNGVELMTALKKQQPDFILLDLKMPEMDGYTAAAKIREEYPDLYIIAQTAYAMADEKNRAMKAGCNDFITKPIKKEVLFYKIDKYLNNIK